ncbi:unnamed protein product [Linum tenue]|nr:unnamed protein product [Linum tenue]
MTRREADISPEVVTGKDQAGGSSKGKGIAE